MDILLINPAWSTKDGNIWHGVKSTSPPLGLLYVAAYAEAKGRCVRILDANAERLPAGDIERYISDAKPRWVGITAVTAQITNALRIASSVKHMSPDSKVVMGGVHATAMPDQVLRDHNVDYVIRGEGEMTFFQLVDGRSLESIRGLPYRSSSPFQGVEHNPLPDPIEDLDALPTPAYHLIKFELYRPAVGAYRRLPAINMTMTRGCPGKCTFCNSAETPLRTRSAQHLVDEIQRLQARYGIREVSFYDDTFTIFKRNITRFCDLIVERRVDLTWACFARVDCISPPLLKKMRAAGCHQIMFGVESADPKILEAIRKPIELDQTRRAVRMVRRAGIEVRAAFLFGNAGETVASMRRTIDFAKSLDPDIATFNITTPYPGTRMFEWAKSNGYLRTLDWDDFDLANSVLDLPTVSSAATNRMYKVAYREFYFRPKYLLRRLLKMRNWVDVRMNLQALRSVLFTTATKPDETIEKAHDRSAAIPATTRRGPIAAAPA